MLVALVSSNCATAQPPENPNCVEQRKTAVSSISFRLGESLLDDNSSPMPVVAGQNNELGFMVASDSMNDVAACFDADALLSLRILVSSKSRFGIGPYFPGYHAQDGESVEHSHADFPLSDLMGSGQDVFLFSIWSAGIQEVRADIVDARKSGEPEYDNSSLVTRLDVLPGELRTIEDVFLSSDVPLNSAPLQDDFILDTFDDFFRVRNGEGDLLLAGYGEGAHASPTGRFGVTFSDKGFRLFDFGTFEEVFELDFSGFVGARDHRLNALAWSKDDSYLVVSLAAEGALLLLPTLVDVESTETWQLGSYSWAGTQREMPGTAAEIQFDYDNLVFRSFFAERSLIAQPKEISLICSQLEDNCPTGLRLGDWNENNWTDPSVAVSFFRTFDNTDAIVAAYDDRNADLNSSHNFYRHRIAFSTYIRRDTAMDVPNPIFWMDDITPRLNTLLSRQGFAVPNVRDLPRIYTTNQYEASRLLREFQRIEAQRNQSTDEMDLSDFGHPFFLEKAWLEALVDFSSSEPRLYAEGYQIEDGETKAEKAEDLIFFPNEIQNEFKYYGHNGVGITLRRQGFQDSAFDKLLYYEPWSGQPNLLTDVEMELVATQDQVIAECNGANGILDRILPWAVRDIWYHEDQIGNRYWIFQSSCTGGIRGSWHHGQLLLLKVDSAGKWTRLNLSDSLRCNWQEECERLGLERASIRVQMMDETHLLLEGFANTLSIVEMDTLQEVATVKIDDYPSASLVLPDSELEFFLALAPDGHLTVRKITNNETIAEGNFIDDELILRRPTGHYFATAEGASFIGFGFDGDLEVYGINQLPDEFFVEHNLLGDDIYENKLGIELSAPPVIDVSGVTGRQADILLGRHAFESVIHYFADGSLRETRVIPTVSEPRIESLQLVGSARTHEFIRVSDTGTRSRPRRIETSAIASKTLYFFATGYGEYEDQGISQLSYPQKDALEWCNFLTSQANSMGYDRVVDLTGGCRHLNGQDLKAVISNLPGMVTADDTVIGFLSGHGIRNETGDFFLLPETAQLSNLSSTAISWNDVATSLNSISARTVLFLDACHSGFASGLTTNDDLAAGIITPNVTVISASKGRQLSWESDALGAGVFSKALLSTFESIERYDVSGDGTLDPEEIYQTARDRVSRFTETTQTPWISRSLPISGGPLFFNSH
ncbi:MAG: caspase family protein [Paracoccaceae bacterium]